MCDRVNLQDQKILDIVDSATDPQKLLCNLWLDGPLTDQEFIRFCGDIQGAIQCIKRHVLREGKTGVDVLEKAFEIKYHLATLFSYLKDREATNDTDVGDGNGDIPPKAANAKDTHTEHFKGDDIDKLSTALEEVKLINQLLREATSIISMQAAKLDEAIRTSSTLEETSDADVTPGSFETHKSKGEDHSVPDLPLPTATNSFERRPPPVHHTAFDDTKTPASSSYPFQTDILRNITNETLDPRTRRSVGETSQHFKQRCRGHKHQGENRKEQKQQLHYAQ